MPGAAVSAAATLAEGGPFQRDVPGFVPRASQQEMAGAVEEVLRDGGTLVAESGTGTGKTFAYLVPVLQQGKRTIVSTGTRHLQDQIFHRDLPRVAAVLGQQVNAVLLKGRSNYLCRYRLRQQNAQESFAGSAVAGLDIINRWAASTREGDIAEVENLPEQSPVWRQVTSTSDNCLGGQCPDHANCFVTRARQRAFKADVVVVNHHLFFSDHALKDAGFGELLPTCDAVVFDEAHGLGEVASGFFGFALSSYQLEELGRDVLVAERDAGSAVDFARVVPSLSLATGRLATLLEGSRDPVLDSGILDDAGFRAQIEALTAALEGLRRALDIAAPVHEALAKCLERAELFQARLDDWCEGRDHDLVRWLAHGKNWFRLQATPLRIDRQFSGMMQHAASWVFTSATLAVGEDFRAFLDQLGIDGQQRRWESPYDFASRTLLYLPPEMPDPRERGYAERLAELVESVTRASRGRAFCLFTSHAMMQRVHRLLRGRLAWPLLVQGESPRGELIDRFRREGNAVLLGTASFWEGVDIPGEALSCVLIDRLPFAAPSDPVLKSRLAACEEGGGNPFMDIQVPYAIQALKQGAGRLIRSDSDRGVLVLCDPRVRTARYGELFLRSLPPMPRSDHLDDVRRFFQEP